MRPASIVQFERLIFAALAIDLVNNLVSWYRMDIASAAGGPLPNPAVGLVIGLLSPLIGLILWYFVARRGSNVARWVTTLLVALGTAGFVALAVKGVPAESRTMFIAGAVAELLKVVAVVFLFTASASAWFARRPQVA